MKTFLLLPVLFLVYSCKPFVTTPESNTDSPAVIYAREDSIMRQQFGNQMVDNCNNIIKLIRANDIERFSKLLPYPIDYNCGMPIKNSEEFIAAYKTHFKSLSAVFNKKPLHVNENTLYYLNGRVYFLGFIMCYDGSIQSFNLPLTDCTEEQRNARLTDSLELYKPLGGYITNLLMCSTDSFLLRIDIVNGTLSSGKMRLSIWPSTSNLSKKPLAVLYSESNQNFGSLDLWHYTFTNNETTYTLQRKTPCGQDNGEQVWLTVSHNKEEQKYKCKRLY